MSRRKSRIPVFIQKKMKKKEFSPSLQEYITGIFIRLHD
jgi:hypothetical protein